MRINDHTKTGLVIAGAVAIALCAPIAAQAHGGHGGGAMSMGMHGGFGGNSASHISANGMANTNGPNATTRVFGQDRANLRRHNTSVSTGVSTESSTRLTPNGGQSASHISASGMANTNGPNATTRTFGRDRANARKALKASTHSSTNTDIDTPQ